MSWHYSQALVAEYLADTSLGGAPFAPLSGSPIPQAFLCSDRMTAFSRLSRFGMTFKPLTGTLGADVLMWFLAGFPAKTSAQPERAQELTAPEAGCGSTWHGSLARFDRATSSWRTPQCSLLEGLDKFSETWPRWGMMRNGECSEQSMPAHLTNETASGLWLPTPLASLGTNCGPNARNSSGRPGLQMAAMLWPTPCSQMSQRATIDGENRSHSTGQKFGLSLVQAVKMWPTPVKSDFKSRRISKNWAGTDLVSQITQAEGMNGNIQPKSGGQLNPTWVEWLMGWPLGWTDLKPLGMDKFQQWCASHGKQSPKEQSK